MSTDRACMTPIEPSSISRSGATVLYLEDSAADAALARGVLEAAGFQVDVVSTPGKCLDRLWHGRYAALFVDHILERFEGTDLIRSFKSLGIELPPTWVVSASDDRDLPARALREGAKGFIEKGRANYASELIEAVRAGR